jgi:excisionase family DNA binding protein
MVGIGREDMTVQDAAAEVSILPNSDDQVNPQESTYCSVAALAADLGLSERSTRSALRRGEIPHIRVGRRFILPRAAIAEWLRTAGQNGTIPSLASTIERPAPVASSGLSEVTVMRRAAGHQ